jgi:hypothetical protein
VERVILFNTAALTPPSRENAARWLREVNMFQTLEVAAVAPNGERKPLWLASLLDMVEFLVAYDESDTGNRRPTVNYADPEALIAWTRDVIGDAELADRMEEVVASRQGYGVLAPELRRLALERVTQCWELLKDEAAE